uniref:FAT domain-containing protein n=1 Tax=Heterorhabditis bacteriophora TaxID=37862 RepID=A0A1I7WVH9_HETBA
MLLQSTIHFTNDSKNVEESGSLDDRLSEVALRLVTPTYTVILNLFRTPHIPNHNLLHRLELRSRYVEEVEGRADCLEATVNILPPLSSILDPVFFSHEIEDPSPIELDSSLEVSLGILPWINRSSHEAASVELLLSLVEQLSGTLVTAPPRVQPPLLKTIQDLLSTIKESEFGRYRVHFQITYDNRFFRYNQNYYFKAKKILIDPIIKILYSTATLHPIRLLISLFVCDSAEEKGDLGEILIDGAKGLVFKDRMLAEQVFLVDSQKCTDHTSEFSSEDQPGNVELILTKSEWKHRLPLSYVISSLLAHQIIIQILGSILISSDTLPHEMKGILAHCQSHATKHQIPKDIRMMMYHCLDASFQGQENTKYMAHQVARDMDSRRGLIALLSKCMRIPYPNLYKQLVSASHIKMYSLYLDRDDSGQNSFKHLQRSLEMIIQELKVIEKRTAEIQVASATREYQEERFEFMLVENDAEKLLKLVSEDEINNTIAGQKICRNTSLILLTLHYLIAYQKQRPITIPAKQTKVRQNPFLRSITNEISNGDPKVKPRANPVLNFPLFLF